MYYPNIKNGLSNNVDENKESSLLWLYKSIFKNVL